MKQALVVSLAVLATALVGCASEKHIKKSEDEGRMLRMDLAETYVRKGAYTAAIPFLIRAVAEFPSDAHIRVLYGTVLREQGLYPQAEKELLEATRLAPSSAAAWASIGVLYDLMRRPTDAEAAHRKAIELAPRNATAWNNLGFSLYVAGRNEEAVTTLETALALDPSLIVAYNNLGFAYGKRGDLESAERCFRTAGGQARALANMAIVHEGRGDDVAAARLRAEAREQDPTAFPEER